MCRCCDCRCAKKKKAKSGRFMKLAVFALLAQVFIYTWTHLILSYLVGVEIAPTVSCAFYAFCGGEAGLLAWIKNTKTKKESEEIVNEGMDHSKVDEP